MRIVWALLVLGCSDGMMRPSGPRTLQVKVNADGSFSPEKLTIYDGDTIEWLLSSRLDAVIPSESADCDSAKPFAPDDFSGPRPLAPSGLYTLSPLDAGFTVGCGCARPKAMANGTCLCEGGPVGATMDSTWASANVTGVFIRLLWNQLQPAADRYDWTLLDREVDQAVKHGKLYSLGVKAGDSGTPDWIFSNGVTRLSFQDLGDDGGTGCGNKMDLGNPTEARYQELYFAMLTEVAAHLSARADWYRALGYIKISGANLFSHENRLPNSCAAGCPCNPQIFAQAGYRPSKLYAFYQAQTALLAEKFPGKTMSYALIQDGFPLVNEAGEWATETGMSSGSQMLPGGTEQTETILKQGASSQGSAFAVQHNGLAPQPPAGTCPNENQHPATGPYAKAGTGCPNHWVLAAGANGQPTGFQTVNASKVMTPADVVSALQNLMVSSDGMFYEIYEERLWEADATGTAVAVEGLHQRRVAFFPSLADPFPTVHRHTFHASAKQTLSYLNPRACRSGSLELRP